MSDFSCSIYITGVGGQGIGLLSETVLRAYDHAGFRVNGVDTHGLAQRGGIVKSQVRVGENVFSPLIEPGDADVVLGMERTEAYRAMITFLRKEGTLVYYDTAWQPLFVRLKEVQEISSQSIDRYSREIGARVIKVFNPDLPDTRMQNMALLSLALRENALPRLDRDHVRAALRDLLSGRVLEDNLSLFSD